MLGFRAGICERRKDSEEPDEPVRSDKLSGSPCFDEPKAG